MLGMRCRVPIVRGIADVVLNYLLKLQSFDLLRHFIKIQVLMSPMQANNRITWAELVAKG